MDPFGTPPTQSVMPGRDQSAGMPTIPNSLPSANSPDQSVQQADLERETMLNDIYKKALEKEDAIRSYRQAFTRISQMDPDHFSLSAAVYEVENAYLDNRLSKVGFDQALQLRVEQVRQILKGQNLSSKNSLSLNYAIQQLFEHPNPYFDAKSGRNYTLPPFKYDFEDYMGEQDYTKMFAAKVLMTGSGQCHSLPLVYLMLAEQLRAKAWLSLAPEHSFVQFMDDRGRLLDYETTNGNIVSGSWIAGSGYINAKALRNRTYLDTLSQKQLYARCLADLLLGYLQKFEYDDFAREICNSILRIDPSNITALIVDANLKRSIAWRQIKAAGTPKPGDLPNFPQAFKSYEDMKEAVDRVTNLGYQDMRPEAYQAWLKSIEVEKKRLATAKLQERIRLEAKLHKSSFQNKKN
ncbi:MAG TPA: hypothetical protein VFE32_19245 [Puia sp.]|nr:hypothetical protein [Puia sp.]